MHLLDNAGLSRLMLIVVIAPGATILVIIVLISFITTFILCTRKSQKSNKQMQAKNPIEVVYDEIQCYESVPGPKDPANRVVLKENAAYGELTM